MPSGSVDLAGKVVDGAGDPKPNLTVSLYQAATWEAAGAATATDTTDSDGLWNFDTQDITKTWLVCVTDSAKNFLIDARNKIQLTNIDIIDDISVDTIYEHTAAGGVTIDGVVLKDSGATFGGDVIVGNGYGVLIGHTAQVTTGLGAVELQVLGTVDRDSAFLVGRWCADANSPAISLVKSRGATVGSNTIVANNDTAGSIYFYVDDGTDFVSQVARIFALVDDATPAANAVGGELVLAVTRTGAQTTNERVNIRGDNESSGVTSCLITPLTPTLPDAATAWHRAVALPAYTATLAGTTRVTTAMDGVQLHIGAPTIAQSGGAVTVDEASSVFISAIVAGTNVTITTAHMIDTNVSGCFLTNAGVWTDASTRAGKTDISPVVMQELMDILEAVEPVSYRYKDISGDGGYRRIGFIAEDVPEALATPRRDGIAAKDIASVALAAAKWLKEENEALKSRVAQLEN